MEFRPIRFEIGLTPTRPTKCRELAKAMNHHRASSSMDNTRVTVMACPSYGDSNNNSAFATHWRLAPSPTTAARTGSNSNSNSSNTGGSTSNSDTSFRLLSPWIQTNEDIAKHATFLKQVVEQGGQEFNIDTNKTVGLRLHVHARGMIVKSLQRLCQLFVKYETVINTLVPESRRTGSESSKKFFKSNQVAITAVPASSSTGRGSSSNNKNTMKLRIEVIEQCRNTESLIALVNPKGSCYKLNLRNVNTADAAALASTSYLEFRQHSMTSNTKKLQGWTALCGALVERAIAISTAAAPLAFRSTRTVEEQFETFLTSVLKNPQWQAFYRERRQELAAPTQQQQQQQQRRQNTSRTTNTTGTTAPTQRNSTTAAAAAAAAAATTTKKAPKRKSSNPPLQTLATAAAAAAANNSTSKRKSPPSASTSTNRGKETSKKSPMCGCCFTKIPSSSSPKVLSCSCQDQGHVFCATCIRKYAEQELYTNQNAKLTCLAIGEECQSEFNSRQLEAILPKNLLHKLREAQYVKHVKTAGQIQCECPKCGCKGMIDKKEKTFSCPSGSCRFHHCRKCGEEAHPNLKCSQVEKQVVSDARTSVEEAMTSALVRKCPQCRTALVRDGGCNHMTCSSCRTEFCYTCRSSACRGCSRTTTDRAAVRTAGDTTLGRVQDDLARRELNGLVDRLM